MQFMRKALIVTFSLAFSSVAAAQSTPIRHAGQSSFGGAGVPSSVLAGVQASGGKHDYTPQQLAFVAKPGSMIRSDISQRFLNRIVTPFAHPVVKSTSAIKVQLMGSAVFLSVDATQTEPVVAYVMDKGDTMDSIAMMLIPKDIGPVELSLQQAGMPGSNSPAFKFDDAKAAKWEQSAPYTETITDLMRTVAQGKVPPGFAFRDYASTDHMPQCQQAGLSAVPRQVLEGHDMVAFVGVLTNTTNKPIEFEEQTCAVRGVLAVASWPGPLLQPKQSAEVYVVVKRGSLPQVDGVRPSALTMGATP